MKKALVIGISNYNGRYGNLPGCLNDMSEWASLLRDQYGFSDDSVRALANDRATKRNILDRIEWLFRGPGLSEVVLFFAGHGARIRRRNYETGDLDDGMDESLVSFPSAKEDIQEHLIFDDELYAIVNSANLAEDTRVTFVFDSCHSGGMLRKLGPPGDLPLPRAIQLPDDILERGSGDPSIASRKFGALRNAQDSEQVIVAAAMDVESAWDAPMADGLRHGAFSYHATRFLRADSSMPYYELRDKVSEQVTRRFPQHPQLLGNQMRFSRSFLS